MPFLSSKSSYQLWSNDENMDEYRSPPPKPQRGILRVQNPIVVPPLNDSQSSNSSPFVCRFKATEKRKQIIEQFQAKLDIDRIDKAFTGREGMDAMIEVIKENMDTQVTYSVAREKAVRLLDLWLQECIFRPKDQEWCHEFQDDKKVLYLFNPVEQHRVIMTPRARSKSCDRKPSRKDSIRSLFRFRSQENNAERNTLFQQEEENIENNRFNNATKPIRIIRNEPDLKDDALIFDAALNCLLLLVDVSLLDEIFAVKDCRTQEQNISFLSSILRRMGIGAEKKMTSIDDIAIFVRSCVHLNRTRNHVISWFTAASKCAPSLHVEKNSTFSNHSQIHDWVRTSLKAVIDNLSCITNNGKNTLIPTEFELFLRAICEQLCSGSADENKRDRAFHYLWLMIPSKLRHHLTAVLDFLQATANTDNCFNFRDPFFVNKQAQELGANFWLVLEELRSFILPQVLQQKDQMSIIEIYLDLRKRTNLDVLPDDVRQFLQGETNIAFCYGEQESNLQKQNRVIEMVDAIIKSNCYTPQRKAELLEECRKAYPEIMNSLYPKHK